MQISSKWWCNTPGGTGGNAHSYLWTCPLVKSGRHLVISRSIWLSLVLACSWSHPAMFEVYFQEGKDESMYGYGQWREDKGLILVCLLSCSGAMYFRFLDNGDQIWCSDCNHFDGGIHDVCSHSGDTRIHKHAVNKFWDNHSEWNYLMYANKDNILDIKTTNAVGD